MGCKERKDKCSKVIVLRLRDEGESLLQMRPASRKMSSKIIGNAKGYTLCTQNILGVASAEDASYSLKVAAQTHTIANERLNLIRTIFTPGDLERQHACSGRDIHERSLDCDLSGDGVALLSTLEVAKGMGEVRVV